MLPIIPDCISRPYPNWVSDQFPDCVPGRFPDYVPDRFPDYVPDRVRDLLMTRSITPSRQEIVDSPPVNQMASRLPVPFLSRDLQTGTFYYIFAREEPKYFQPTAG